MITSPLEELVSQLRRLLETVGDGLVENRIGPLLSAEPHLETTLQSLAARELRMPSEDTETVRQEIAACRRALERCRRLGASMESFVAAMLQATGRASSYTRAGDAAIVPPEGRLEVRG